jgi:hypothetical protein
MSDFNAVIERQMREPDHGPVDGGQFRNLAAKPANDGGGLHEILQ